jgi:hypothetical protein
VQKIILAYEKFDREKRERAEARKSSEAKKTYIRKDN